MTTPNEQERSAYFAQYIGSQLEYESGQIAENTISFLHCASHVLDKCCLVLKPLSDISDEDAIEVATLYGLRADSVPEDALIEMGISVVMNNPDDLPLRIIDFLRSRGYALPWRQYSVEELIEAGVLKLQENGKDTN